MQVKWSLYSGRSEYFDFGEKNHSYRLSRIRSSRQWIKVYYHWFLINKLEDHLCISDASVYIP